VLEFFNKETLFFNMLEIELKINKSIISVKDSNQIQAMFNSIATRYDFLNQFLSVGCDRHWRRIAVDQLGKLKNKVFLDMATGTADIAIEIAKRSPKALRITGIDCSNAMLEIGRNKINKAKLNKTISLIPGSAENIPIKDHFFDGAITAFGVRNFSDYHKGLREINRVLKPNGILVILEFSFPKNTIMQWIYGFYFKKILPLVGRIVSGHKTAYSYLPGSVIKFPQGETFKTLLYDSGFKKVSFKTLSLGIVTLYSGIKNV
tara:strand:- start:3624 stop:4409 length:786 start_codon:yes stop_codon:yes gene_type:complete